MAYYRQTRFGLERLESKPLQPPEKKQERKPRKRTPKQQESAEKTTAK